MKKILSIILTIAFIVSLVFNLNIFAKNETDFSRYSFEDLFDAAVKSDSYIAMAIETELGDRFISNPKWFIKNLEKYDNKEYNQDVIKDMLSASLFFDHNDEYKDILKKAKMNSGGLEISEILNSIESKMSAYSIPVKNSEVTDISQYIPKFSPYKLNKALRDVNFTDDEIETLNSAYEYDKAFFLKRLSKESDNFIYKVAEALSLEGLSNDISLNSKNLDADINEKYSVLINNISDNGFVDFSESVVTASSSSKWEILVGLHEHAYGGRNYVGQAIILYKPDGSYYWSTNTLLGRSVSGASPMVYKGNTPQGVYNGWLAGPSSPTSSFGPHKVIATSGLSGDIITSGRSGIWIHGGTPSTNTSATWYPLRPTYGCVRITNSDQNILQTKIQNLINAGASSAGTIEMCEF